MTTPRKAPPRKRGSHRGPDTTGPKAIQVAQRHAKWLEDRLSGMTYRAIAARDKVDPKTVHEAVANAIAATKLEPAKQLRDLQLERLDAMLAGMWVRAKKGDEKAASLVLKLEERRAKLLGLDAPTQSTTRLTIVGQIQFVLDMIREELGEDAAQRIYRRLGELGGDGGEEAGPQDEDGRAA